MVVSAYAVFRFLMPSSISAAVILPAAWALRRPCTPSARSASRFFSGSARSMIASRALISSFRALVRSFVPSVASLLAFFCDSIALAAERIAWRSVSVRSAFSAI
ncbi:hypothetical protein D3C78_1409750 [compost metagenome]